MVYCLWENLPGFFFFFWKVYFFIWDSSMWLWCYRVSNTVSLIKSGMQRNSNEIYSNMQIMLHVTGFGECRKYITCRNICHWFQTYKMITRASAGVHTLQLFLYVEPEFLRNFLYIVLEYFPFFSWPFIFVKKKTEIKSNLNVA